MQYDSDASSNSWTSRAKYQDVLERPLCYCGIPSKLRIYTKDTSFDKRFFSCLNYKMNKQCIFSIDWFWNWTKQLLQNNIRVNSEKNDRINQELVMAEESKF